LLDEKGRGGEREAPIRRPSSDELAEHVSVDGTVTHFPDQAERKLGELAVRAQLALARKERLPGRFEVFGRFAAAHAGRA
jgi:hypothetical protein